MFKMRKTNSSFGLYGVVFETPYTLRDFIKTASSDKNSSGRIIIRAPDISEALSLNYKNGRTRGYYSDLGDRFVNKASALKSEFGYDYLISLQ